MTWDSFIWFGMAAAVLSAVAAVVSLCANDRMAGSSSRYRSMRVAAISFASLALAVLASFIILFWINIEINSLSIFGFFCLCWQSIVNITTT